MCPILVNILVFNYNKLWNDLDEKIHNLTLKSDKHQQIDGTTYSLRLLCSAIYHYGHYTSLVQKNQIYMV